MQRNKSVKKSPHSQVKPKQGNPEQDIDPKTQSNEVKVMNGSARNMSKKRSIDQISNTGQVNKNGAS